jgi:hypothetical protein
MREMVPLEVAKVRVSEVVKVNGMMCPFLSCIACDSSSQEYRKGIDGRNKTERRGYAKERKQIVPLGVNMMAIIRVTVMFPVKRIQPGMKVVLHGACGIRKSAVHSEAVAPLSRDQNYFVTVREVPMQNKAVCQIFDERPKSDTGNQETACDPYM